MYPKTRRFIISRDVVFNEIFSYNEVASKGEASKVLDLWVSNLQITSASPDDTVHEKPRDRRSSKTQQRETQQ